MPNSMPIVETRTIGTLVMRSRSNTKCSCTGRAQDIHSLIQLLVLGFAVGPEIDVDRAVRAGALKGERLLEMVDAQAACLALGIVCGEIAFDLRQRDRAGLDASRLQDRLERKDQPGNDDHRQRNGEGDENPAVQPQQNGLGHGSGSGWLVGRLGEGAAGVQRRLNIRNKYRLWGGELICIKRRDNRKSCSINCRLWHKPDLSCPV